MVYPVWRLCALLIFTVAVSLGLCACSSDGNGNSAANHDPDAQTVWGSTERNPHTAPLDGPGQDHHSGQ